MLANQRIELGHSGEFREPLAAVALERARNARRPAIVPRGGEYGDPDSSIQPFWQWRFLVTPASRARRTAATASVAELYR